MDKKLCTALLAWIKELHAHGQRSLHVQPVSESFRTGAIDKIMNDARVYANYLKGLGYTVYPLSGQVGQLGSLDEGFAVYWAEPISDPTMEGTVPEQRDKRVAKLEEMNERQQSTIREKRLEADDLRARIKAQREIIQDRDTKITALKDELNAVNEQLRLSRQGHQNKTNTIIRLRDELQAIRNPIMDRWSEPARGFASLNQQDFVSSVDKVQEVLDQLYEGKKTLQDLIDQIKQKRQS